MSFYNIPFILTKGQNMIPTIELVMKTYPLIAQMERAKTGRPGEATVKNVLRGTALYRPTAFPKNVLILILNTP